MNFYNVIAAAFAGFIASLCVVLGLTIHCLIFWASWQVSPWYLLCLPLCLPLWWSVLNGLSFAVKEAQNKS